MNALVAITVVKLLLWGFTCASGAFSRWPAAVAIGAVLGGIFAVADLAMFHFFLGTASNLPAAAAVLFILHCLAVSIFLFAYHRTEDLFYSLLSVGLGGLCIALVIPRYCFNWFFGSL